MFHHKHLSILLFACSLTVTTVVACATNSPTQKIDTNPSFPANKPSPETICKTAIKDPSGVIRVDPEVETAEDVGPLAILLSETPVAIGNRQKNRTQINQPVQGWINSNQVSQVCKQKLTTQQVETLLQEAVDRTISGDYKDAIQALTEILWNQPDHADAYYKIGIASFHLSLLHYREPQGDLKIIKEANQYYRVSFDNFKQATRLAPRSAEAFLYRGLTQHDSDNDYDKSFTEAIRLNPNLAEAYYYRAIAPRRRVLHNRIGDESWHDLDKAISLDPNFAEAYHMRFLFYYHDRVSTSDRKSYYKDLLQALRLDPQFTESFEVSTDRMGRPLLSRAPYPQLLLAKLNQRIQAN